LLATGVCILSLSSLTWHIKLAMQVLKKLFQTKYFVINLLPDVPGAEMCGTLKNIVALAAGFIDGIGLGPNSKAAIMRQVRTAIAPVRQMMAAPGHTAVS
jgi:glycerol-3-phosphate dehydrogenase (NAD+)